MKLRLDLYDLCRNFVNDSTNWLPAREKELILGLIRARDFRTLAQLATDPRINITNARSCRFYLQVEAFFKKNEDLRDENVVRPAAIAAFERGERLCRITNKRLDYYYAHEGRLDPHLLLLIRRAARFIENALGDYGNFLNSIPEFVKITSGATALRPRKHSQPAMKLMRTMDACPGTVPYLSALSNHYGLKGLTKIKGTPWNRVEFVAKNWKTDRTIACEPTGSLPFQLAFDGYVKTRLKKHGIDLSDQSRNQRHAYEGSITNDLCTIDLSMASDTLSYNTVAWLLPQQWFDYLRAHRSSRYRHPATGADCKYAKFSSMGNGATFALETLVFLSFVRASGSSEGLVYGDDITIERTFLDNLLALLRFFGFVPNMEKSFTDGPFRESCGEHFYEGVSVTPFYVRTTAVWNRPAACHNVNGLVPLSEHGQLWEYLRGFVKANNLPCVPVDSDSMSGVHIHPFHAYQEKLIKRTKVKGVLCTGGSLSAKRFVLKTRTHAIHDSRGYLLWHIRANPGNVRQEEPMYIPLVNPPPSKGDKVSRLISTSSYSSTTQKYALRWMVWHMPDQGVSASLFSWSDLLFGNLQIPTR